MRLQDLDHAAMADALKGGANVHAMDEDNRHPLGVSIEAWQRAQTPPAPDTFVSLLARHGADLRRPEGGESLTHTIDGMEGTDSEVPLLEALADTGMGWSNDIDEGELFARMVRNRSPQMLACLLLGPFKVDSDALDEDSQTALHQLVDARLDSQCRDPDETVSAIMTILSEAGCDDYIADFGKRTAIHRFGQEAPGFILLWRTLKRRRRAVLERLALDCALPQAQIAGAESLGRRL